VLDLLRDRGVPMTADELAGTLEVKPASLLAFHNRLLAMERDGQLLRNRKGALCIVDKLDLIVGRIEGHADGHGFLIPDGKKPGDPDVFIGANEMRKVLHGDRVSARIDGSASEVRVACAKLDARRQRAGVRRARRRHRETDTRWQAARRR
jgi:ribonuclease R